MGDRRLPLVQLMETTTFIPAGRTTVEMREILLGNGFVVGQPVTSTSTVLDTFDGLLHQAGMRLTLRCAPDSVLVLTSSGSPPATMPVTQATRFAADLSAGPFRSRLAAVTGFRALLPVVSFTERVTTAVRRDREGKTAVTLTLHEPITDGHSPALMIDVTEHLGHPKPAARARKLLSAIGCTTLGHDVVGQIITSSGADPAGFDSSPAVPLDASQPAIVGWQTVLAGLALTIDANWQGTIDEIDPEFLHELRVAVRRSRSVIAQGKRILPDAVRKTFREEFGWLGAITGPPRDLDVYVIEWSRYVAPLGPLSIAALQPVLEHLQAHRGRAHADLIEAMRSERAAQLLTTWAAWLHATPDTVDPSEHANHSLGRVVAERISDLHETLLDHGRRITDESPAQDLHDLRKIAKKLRYLFECFATVMATKPVKSFVSQLKQLQDNLGEHQDAAVHADELRAVAAELNSESTSPDTFIAIGRLSERLELAKASARDEFPRRFDAYDSKPTRRLLRGMLEALDR